MRCTAMHKNKFIMVLAFLCSMGAVRVLAQANTATPRITAPVDNSKLVVLSGTIHPLARQQNDRGLAPASLPMAHMLLVLQRSPQQQTALESLISEQQDRNSPNYHKWLTPAQFGAEFGAADQDIQTITAWLQSQGFTVNGVPAGRTVIDFSGTAATVQAAFHTAIHQYVLPNGEQHFANSTNIEIPAALAPVVAGVRSLNNFFPKPQHHAAVRPAFTFAFGGACGPNTNNCFDVTPADFATIYNLPTTTWTGANETIAIVSDSDINATDLQQFRSIFGLTAMTNNAPSSSAPTCTAGVPCFVQFVPPTQTDPGIQCPLPGQAYSPGSCTNSSNGDEVEADIDAEWAGATAPGANIWLVNSADSGATFGGELSATYVVNCPTVSGACPVAVPADVLSDSYGSCEATLGSGGNAFYSSTWSQAETEGITVVVASGDSGSAGCDANDGTPPQVAEQGLAVNGTASTPNNVAVGGTDFNQASNPTQFWSTSNSTTGESALGYIPETTWNDSCTNALFGNDPIANCNSGGAGSPDFVFILGGGGGPSTCATFVGASCSAGYAKPAWQTGVTPADSVRDVPDISLFAGNGFVGSAYIMCELDMPGQVGASGQEGTACSLSQPPSSTGAISSFEEVGGTSAAAQAFAGITALIDQQAGANQGNISPNLYTLANAAGNTCSSAASPASTCVFYDVTSGTISQPCDATGPSPDCTTSGADTVGVLESGGQLAYNAAANYDLATGLGSVNVENLLCNWPGGTVTCTSTALLAAPTTITVGASVTFTATVTQQSGGTTPTGTVDFLDGGTNIGNGTLTAGVANFMTTALTVGTHSITAAYQGTSAFAPSTSSAVQVTVNPAPTPDFTVSASPSSQTVTPGNSTSYTLTLTPENGFNQAVTVSCSGAPTEATCTPASTSVTLNGTSASTDTINVTTTAPSLVVRVTPPFSGWRILATIGSFALFLLIADGFIRRSMSARRWVAAAGFAVLIVFAVAGCGGGSNNNSTQPSGGTPAGTYTLTITGTAGATTHSTTVSLVVQ